METDQWLIVADSLQVIGDVVIALVVFSVHLHIMKERKIDRDVIRFMKRERAYVIVGICSVIAGFLIEMGVRAGFF